jgi:CRP/FNR family transcriptional regulator
MQQFPFFDLLSDESRRLLLDHADTLALPEGTELFSQGDRCREVLFLQEGSIRVYRSHESGQEITLYFLEAGEQCNVNLNSAFTGAPAIATAVTESEIGALMLPADIVKQVYAKEAVYQQYVFTLFARRLESLAGLIEDIRFKKLDQRLLDWLREHERQSSIEITHERLASHLGTSREVVSRLLKEFERSGIVKLHRGRIEQL